MSAFIPTDRLPLCFSSPSALAGLKVVISITCSRFKPRAKNLDMVTVRLRTIGVSKLGVTKSVLNVVGSTPFSKPILAMLKLKLNIPLATSRTTPLLMASQSSAKTVPSGLIMPPGFAVYICSMMSPLSRLFRSSMVKASTCFSGVVSSSQIPTCTERGSFASDAILLAVFIASTPWFSITEPIARIFIPLMISRFASMVFSMASGFISYQPHVSGVTERPFGVT